MNASDRHPALRLESQGEPATDFDRFFHAATDHWPFDYQRRLACGTRPADPLETDWLHRGTPCVSRLIRVPTGMGKTAAAILAWLWNRLHVPRAAAFPEHDNHRAGDRGPSHPWPRRLVYCLPMRVLVEQTAHNVRTWLSRLWQHRHQLGLNRQAIEELRWLAGDETNENPAHAPVILMGGEPPEPAASQWDLYPEKPCLLIGTQDMLLSRALNRGYGMSRYRWPLHFGLLNNDCLWVMDETQLMGVGLETSAQLEGFRKQFHVAGSGCFTWWMSATLDDERLATVDHPPPAAGWSITGLDPDDLHRPEVRARYEADKPLASAPIGLSAGSKKSYARDLAQFVLEQHQPGSLTLVLLNRVDRAQALYLALRRLKPVDPLGLVHSRFRPADRANHEQLLLKEGGRIVVATQAVEAGMDVSCRVLITELAPWSSLVQRFGRCHRRGEFSQGDARIFWVDIQPKNDRDEVALPYAKVALDHARSQLQQCANASPQALQAGQVPERQTLRPIIRRKDILELFDTTPDLAGYDVDISRFIRDGEDTDVHLYWRALRDGVPSTEEPAPACDEICSVSFFSFRAFLNKLSRRPQQRQKPWPVWHWNPLTEQWEQAHRARPGAVYLLDLSAGGYSCDLGWFGAAEHAADLTPIRSTAPAALQAYSRDPASSAGAWITLADHTRHVMAEARNVAQAFQQELSAVGLNSNPLNLLETAARWHDLGKAHEAFQAMLCGPDPQRRLQLWAKSDSRRARCARPFFRHELASALAWLQTRGTHTAEGDLIAYLVAAHHGKVRLSIRSLPGEEPPAEHPPTRIARGVIEGDTLPPAAFTAIGEPPPPQPLRLSLEPMEMGCGADGEPSWLARMIALRDRFGPFRLAWLETLLRVADIRASINETPPRTQP